MRLIRAGLHGSASAFSKTLPNTGQCWLRYTAGGTIPLPTLPFPHVTKWEIVYPKPKLEVHINDSEAVLVHTDADVELDRQGRLSIRAEPDCLELAGQSKLTGWRMRWRLRSRHTAKAGDVGKVIATIPHRMAADA